MDTAPISYLIHVAFINPGKTLLFLRKLGAESYTWTLLRKEGNEEETGITGTTIEEAIAKARRKWKDQAFRTLNCGFRYTLPERDEHGINALFHQMALSYKSSNGVYFDEDLGHDCFVNFASTEAKELLKRELQNSL